MKQYFFPDEKDKTSQKGTSEDPPTDVTKQNQPGGTEEKEKIDVPKEALENYKESAAKDSEE